VATAKGYRRFPKLRTTQQRRGRAYIGVLGQKGGVSARSRNLGGSKDYWSEKTIPGKRVWEEATLYLSLWTGKISENIQRKRISAYNGNEVLWTKEHRFPRGVDRARKTLQNRVPYIFGEPERKREVRPKKLPRTNKVNSFSIIKQCPRERSGRKKSERVREKYPEEMRNVKRQKRSN